MKNLSTQAGKIGIFDSGLGGLTILKEIVTRLPEREYLYLGDNLNVPYGNKTREEIYDLTLAGVRWLFDAGAEIIILACNTASANALRKIQQEILPMQYPTKKVLGIIIPTVEEIEVFTKSGHIGVLATQATVHSHLFEIEMKKKNPAISLISKTGGKLALYVEENKDEEVLLREIQRVITELLSHDPLIDTVVLGCTHYALIEKYIRNIVPQEIHIIGQGEIIAKKLEDYLMRHKEISERLSPSSSVRFFTTKNDEHTRIMMKKFYGADILIQSIEKK